VDIGPALNCLQSKYLAVRSSASIEDSRVASFAGSFDTLLGVKKDNVANAIFQVWLSGTQERIAGYATSRGLDLEVGDIRMAVLIQEQIDPLYAGIAFSHFLGQERDPYIFTSVVRGIGEPLVSGEVNGQSYWIERLTYRIARYRDAIDLADIYELAAKIGRTVERLEILRQGPQDVEYAVTNDYEFVLLQNRPMTKTYEDTTDFTSQ
jgi:pyruvate,water dikinase